MARKHSYSTLYLAALLRRYPNMDTSRLRPFWLNRYICEHGYEPADVYSSYSKALRSARRYNALLEATK